MSNEEEFDEYEDVVYGFPCVENPHDFSPDSECCTPKEIAFHEDAKRRWDSGGRNVRGVRSESVRDKDTGELLLHLTRTSWGIGTNYFRRNPGEVVDAQ